MSKPCLLLFVVLYYQYIFILKVHYLDQPANCNLPPKPCTVRAETTTFILEHNEHATAKLQKAHSPKCPYSGLLLALSAKSRHANAPSAPMMFIPYQLLSSSSIQRNNRDRSPVAQNAKHGRASVQRSTTRWRIRRNIWSMGSRTLRLVP